MERRHQNGRLPLNLLYPDLENKILPQAEDLVRVLPDLTAYRSARPAKSAANLALVGFR
jgi:hypothetical protein